MSSSFPSTGYPYLENILLLDQQKFSIIWRKNSKNNFCKIGFVTSNRYKFQIKDKRLLLILNVQNIVFHVIKICPIEIFLSVLNQAYHVSNSSNNLRSFLCPIFLGIFPPLLLYHGGIFCLIHC